MIQDDHNKRELRGTRHLNTEPTEASPPVRGTGPLDYFMPWVIEFRIVGTPHVKQLQLEHRMVIGRSDKVHGASPDIDLGPYQGYEYGVSRKHAIIETVNSRVTIKDLNSANGSQLNGGRMEPDREYRLRHGDRLTFGRLEVQVSFVVTPSSYEKNETAYSEINIPAIGQGQYIMMVDDDRNVSQTLAYAMEIAGFRVRTLESITEAMTLLEAQLPDAIILELILAEQNGLDLINHVRTVPGGAALPVIVVSSVSAGYHMGRAIDAGVEVFLTKPVGIDELMRGLSKILPLMRG